MKQGLLKKICIICLAAALAFAAFSISENAVYANEISTADLMSQKESSVLIGISDEMTAEAASSSGSENTSYESIKANDAQSSAKADAPAKRVDYTNIMIFGIIIFLAVAVAIISRISKKKEKK